MKKLGKKLHSTNDTVTAYACSCACPTCEPYCTYNATAGNYASQGISGVQYSMGNGISASRGY